jgi:hypothetical protein
MKKEKPIGLDQMTLRDFYAVFAMVGDLASGTEADEEKVAAKAYDLANEMMKARNDRS